MKIATYNVNSVRKRLPIVLDWLATYEPDVLALQETKVEDGKFPLAEFEDLGYQVAIHGQKSYNGVALLSRHPLRDVQSGFADPLFPEDCRILRAEIEGVTVINTYVPNGTKVGSDKFAYKLQWLERFRTMLASRYRPDQPLVWLGDINIAPEPIDVYDSKKVYGGVGHHPEEFSRLRAIVDWGLCDCFRRFYPDRAAFTYFDYFVANAVDRGLGWRIDHIYASEGLAGQCRACEIDLDPRREVEPSDHTVVWADFS